MILHEYWEDNDGSRYASVKREDDGSYTVSMYENNRLIEDRNIKESFLKYIQRTVQKTNFKSDRLICALTQTG